MDPSEEAPQQHQSSTDEILTTGLWGKRSKRDVMVVGGLVCTAILALVIVIAVVVTGGNDDGGSGPGSELISTRPVDADLDVTVTNPQEKLDLIHAHLALYEATAASYAVSISKSASAMSAETVSDETQPPEVRAAAWVLYVDVGEKGQEKNNVIRRFAVATFYYGNGGSEWTDNTNWMTIDKSHCEWYGILCAGDASTTMGAVAAFLVPVDDVFEIDMRENNVSGILQDVLVLMQGLHSLYLDRNNLTGAINGPAISKLPIITRMYLQHNQLTGTVPTTLTDNGHFDTIYIQANNITGTWPEHYCRSCTGCTDNIHYFGIDCDEIECSPNCCRVNYNCYYPDYAPGGNYTYEEDADNADDDMEL